jgi:hypothetical protein
MGAIVIWGFAILVVGIVVAMFLVLAKIWAAYVVAVVAEPSPATSAGSIGLAIVLIAGSIFLEPFLTSLVPALGIALVALPFGALAVAIARASLRALTDRERRHRALLAAGALGGLVGVGIAVHVLPAWRERERADREWAPPVASAVDEVAVGEAVLPDAGPRSLGEVRLCPCDFPVPPAGPTECSPNHVWSASDRAADHFCISLRPELAAAAPAFVHVEHWNDGAGVVGWALLASQELMLPQTGLVVIGLPHAPDRRLRVVVRTADHAASASTELPAP